MRHVKKRYFVALLLAVAVVLGAIAGPRVVKRLGLFEPEPFAWSSYLDERTRQQVKRNWNSVIKKGPLATQKALAKATTTNTIDRGSYIAFQAVADDPKSRAMFQRYLSELDTADHRSAIIGLYDTLMRAPPNKDILFEKLSRHLNGTIANAYRNPGHNGRFMGWALATGVYASLIAYERTGDIRFIREANLALMAALKLRDDTTGRVDEVRGRVMHGWGGNKYDAEGRHMTNFTLAGRVAFVLALFADTVKRHPELQSKYADQAKKFLNAARETMDDYSGEFVVDGDIGYYKRPVYNDIEPLNHMAWAGNALILLNKQTGEVSYGQMAEQLARFFKQSMRHENGTVWWPYQPGSAADESRPEYIWKASLTSQFMFFAWQNGVVFTDSDMEAITNTILSRVFRPEGRISALMGGPFENLATFKMLYGDYLSVTPFIVFECANPKVRDKIDTLVASRPDIGGWMRGTYGVIAYAHRLGPNPPCGLE